MNRCKHNNQTAPGIILSIIATLLIGGLLFAEPSVAEPEALEPGGPGSQAPWAQQQGFSLGMQFQANVIGASDPDATSDGNAIFVDETGGGATFHVGYTFVPAFSLRLAVGIARHETTREAVEAFYNTVAFEAHWRFLPHERARPYIYGAVGGAGFLFDTNEFNSEASGGMVGLGFGLLYNLTRHLVLDMNTRLDLINWNEVTWTREVPGIGEASITAPIDDDGSAWRFQLGVAWEF